MATITGMMTGSIKSVAVGAITNLVWYSVLDNSGGGATVNIGITNNGAEMFFKSIVLAANASYSEVIDVKVPNGGQIIIVASALVYYLFTTNLTIVK